LEIGCATGFSTVLMTRFAKQLKAEQIISIDLLPHFYGNQEKEVGFLTKEFLNPEEEKILTILSPFTSYDLPQITPNKNFDFVFIDGSHQHPWPTLDMIAILPHISKNATVVHHDLNLYKRKRCMHDLGPKYIFDQFDLSEKDILEGKNPNIFSLNLTMYYKEYTTRLIDSLCIPWSLRNRPPAKLMFQIGHYIEKYWSDTELYHWYCFSLERYY